MTKKGKDMALRLGDAGSQFLNQTYNVRLSKDQIERLETASSLVESLEMICDLFPGKVVFSSSLGQEDQVITDAIFKNDLPVKIFTLDTGRLF